MRQKVADVADEERNTPGCLHGQMQSNYILIRHSARMYASVKQEHIPEGRLQLACLATCCDEAAPHSVCDMKVRCYHGPLHVKSLIYLAAVCICLDERGVGVFICLRLKHV